MYWYLLLLLLCLALVALLLSFWLTRQHRHPKPAQAPTREELTSTMVHDLRSPISNTLTALTMLQADGENQLSADGQLLLDLTVTNTEKTLHLVNQILELSQLEQDGLPLQKTAVSLPNLVEAVLHRQQPMADKHTVRLISQLPSDLSSVYGDASLLERVLQNLVDNAIQASPEGRQVFICASAETTHVTVSVIDEGSGVPPELETAVFDKYISGRPEGSGLGLAFCQMALNAHHESIWYQKNASGGATFSFRLPIAKQSQSSPISF